MKYVLVTGVSTGIGYDAVRYLTNRGWYVFGSVRKDSDIQRLETAFPDNFTCLKFDITRPAEILASVATVEKRIGDQKLAGLVNNAGYAVGGPMALLEDELFRDQIEVNLFGARNLTNAFLPLLGTDTSRTGPPGRLIMISSISGVLNTPLNGAYCVSKHALESLAEVYRRELMIFGIQVSSIRSGPIESDLWTKNIGTLSKYRQTAYGTMAHNTEQAMIGAQADALPAETISKLIEEILQSDRPNLSYLVNKNRFLTWLLINIIPRRITDRLIFRRLNKACCCNSGDEPTCP